MSLVVDASVAVQWFFQHSGTERANAILRTNEPIVAPDLVIAEITNTAWRLATFDDLPINDSKDTVREAARFFYELVPSTLLKDRALAIALDLRHPVYDCFYLALAEMRDIEFITADGRLLRRCVNTRFATRVRAL
jgi:predicted nucleic acid-binding protein